MAVSCSIFDWKKVLERGLLKVSMLASISFLIFSMERMRLCSLSIRPNEIVFASVPGNLLCCDVTYFSIFLLVTSFSEATSPPPAKPGCCNSSYLPCRVSSKLLVKACKHNESSSASLTVCTPTAPYGSGDCVLSAPGSCIFVNILSTEEIKTIFLGRVDSFEFTGGQVLALWRSNICHTALAPGAKKKQ